MRFAVAVKPPDPVLIPPFASYDVFALVAQTQLLLKVFPAPTALVPHHDSAFERTIELETMLYETLLFPAERSPKITPSPLPSMTLCWTTAPCEPRSCTPRSELP